MPPVVNFSGIASGIDSSALIKAILDQQRAARIAPLETAITRYQETSSSFDRLKELLADLDSVAQSFRTLNGGAVGKLASSSDESTLTATASSSASTGVYNITVNALAKNASFSFDDRYASSTSAVDAGINDLAASGDRTLSFNIGTGGSAETVDVVLTSSSTLSDIAASFNSQSDKARASVVNTGTSASPSYALVITSNKEGLDEGSITLNSIGSEISVFAVNTLDQASDASISVSGISGAITRSSNTISDVIEGLTFELQDLGTSRIVVGVDSQTTKGKVQDFVEAYNALVEFIAEEDLTAQDEETKEMLFGSLSSSSIDENIISSLRSAFSSSSLSGNIVNVLADLGISTQRDGTLAFDEEAFQDAIDSDPSSVGNLLGNLGETLGAVNGTIAQFTRFNGILDMALSANQSSILNSQSRIDEIETSLARQETTLLQRFARLEGLIGKMNSQQSTLAGLLPG